MENLTVRQCLAEFPDALVGDLGVFENQPLEGREPLQVLQSRVGDLGTPWNWFARLEARYDLPIAVTIHSVHSVYRKRSERVT